MPHSRSKRSANGSQVIIGKRLSVLDTKVSSRVVDTNRSITGTAWWRPNWSDVGKQRCWSNEPLKNRLAAFCNNDRCD
ncbi:MAG: hypothetical protein GX594_07550 [Pirellulaceae bacterium]|nr:hypothetical protein [Pirellulaceae bacterium]